MHYLDVIHGALNKWASDPSDAPAPVRESLCASLVGASLVEHAITKLAEAGRVTPEEAAFLRSLHEEAVADEVSVLTKSAGIPEWIGNAISYPLHHPRVTGTALGTLAGAGYGAWRDEDNPARGALLYAVPGAAAGYVGGRLGEEMIGAWANRQPHSLTREAESLTGDAVALAKARLRSEVAGRAVAQRGPTGRGEQAAFTDTLAKRVATRNHLDAVHVAQKIQQHEDAQRWHSTLMDTAERLEAMPSVDPAMRQFATSYKDTLGRMKDRIIDHQFRNPGKIHTDVLDWHMDENDLLHKLHAEAAKRFAQGV